MREVAGEYILVPISKTAFSGNSMMMLNETSSFIWNNLQEFSTLDSLIDRAKREFEDPDNVLEQQIYAFITSMVELGLIEERGL